MKLNNCVKLWEMIDFLSNKIEGLEEKYMHNTFIHNIFAPTNNYIYGRAYF